jgi:hypothetical protein
MIRVYLYHFNTIIMALESYKKEQDRLEKEEAKKAGMPEEVKDEGATLKEIMADDKQNALLGEMVQHDGSDEDKKIFVRLVSGKMAAADIKELAGFRDKFVERMRQAESIEEEMTPELAQYLAEKNPDIKRLLKLSNADEITSAVKEIIKQVAVTDPENFKKISKNVENVKSFRNGDFKKLDDIVAELCKKQGINADKYLDAMAINDFDKRQKALSDLVKEQWKGQGGWGNIKRSLNWIAGDIFSTNKAVTLEGDNKRKLNEAFEQLEGYKKKVGSALAGTIKGNEDLLEALSREIVGTPKKKEMLGMNDAKKQMLDEDNFQRGWQKVKNNIKNWDTLDEKARDVHRDNYMKQFETDGKAELAKAKGFWALIFGGVFDMMFAGFDKKSLN